MKESIVAALYGTLFGVIVLAIGIYISVRLDNVDIFYVTLWVSGFTCGFSNSYVYGILTKRGSK